MWCRPCQSVGKASLGLACVVVAAGLILIFLFDLPGGDDVGPGPMTKYKIITTHFQVSCHILPLIKNCTEHTLMGILSK